MASLLFGSLRTRWPLSMSYGSSLKRTAAIKTKGRTWTPEEDAKLTSLRQSGQTFREIARHIPSRSESGCANRWRCVVAPRDSNGDIIDPKLRLWQPGDKDVVSEMREAGAGWDDIAKRFPDRSPRAVRSLWYKAVQPIYRKLSSPPAGPRRWTSEEDTTLVSDRFRGMRVDEVAAKLGRTASAINMRFLRIHAGVVRPRLSPSLYWSQKDDAKLTRLAENGLSPEDIAQQFPGRDHHAVQARLVGRRRMTDGTARTNVELRQQLLDLRAAGLSWSEIQARLPDISRDRLYSTYERASKAHPAHRHEVQKIHDQQKTDQLQSLVDLRAQGLGWDEIQSRFTRYTSRTLRNYFNRAVKQGFKPQGAAEAEQFTS